MRNATGDAALSAAALGMPAGESATARVALGAGAGRRELTVDGVRLAYDEAGSGVPLLCLHAIGHGASDFRDVAARFAARHRVIALDWPGHGRSADDSQPPSAQRYAALLAELVERLQLPPAVLLGNSIGAAAAIRFAAAHPERVRALVIENSGGLDRPDRLARTVIGAMVRFFAAGAAGARWYPGLFAAYYRLVLPNRAAAAQRGRIVATAYESAPLLRDAWSSFAQPEADIRHLAETVSCPVLFAWATRDRFVQLRRSLPAIQRFPAGRLERFRAGHAPHLETPDAFCAALEQFLRAH
jgi:pimeloyl-ACP methyl ester carboxylesterase